MKKEFEKLKVIQVFIKQPCYICGILPDDRWYIRNPTYGKPTYMCPRCIAEKGPLPFFEDWIAMEKDWCIVEYKTTLSRWFRKKEEQTRFVISSVKI
jgi:hypothetical protein